MLYSLLWVQRDRWGAGEGGGVGVSSKTAGLLTCLLETHERPRTRLGRVESVASHSCRPAAGRGRSLCKRIALDLP